MSKNIKFKFASGICGFKDTGKPDLAVIYSEVPCTQAGVFTSNQVHAACVDENKRLLKKKKKIRAVVVNSGNANACTGQKGISAVKQTQKIAAKLLRIKPDEVLVASTGLIGIYLDMKKMKNGLENAILKLSSGNLKKAARAILTTDRFVKLITKKSRGFYLVGFTKGAGMIHPNMATMLCFFMTDLKMSQNLLQDALNNSVKDTFNNISVDGDMSTNDMVILLSNNQSSVQVNSSKDPIYMEFQKVLSDSCSMLAKEIIIDGEGAKKLITVQVLNARKKDDASKIAKSIASSILFKCAVFGSDPNWGRAAARIGGCGVKVDPGRFDIFLNKTKVYGNGHALEFNRKKVSREIKRQKGLKVTVNLKSGKYSAVAYGCDLSYDFLKFNSAYFT